VCTWEWESEFNLYIRELLSSILRLEHRQAAACVDCCSCNGVSAVSRQLTQLYQAGTGSCHDA
jgi:hypothetical protein